MPPLVDYFIPLSLMDRSFALNGTGSKVAYTALQLISSCKGGGKNGILWERKKISSRDFTLNLQILNGLK
jgi:hypothetical protein